VRILKIVIAEIVSQIVLNGLCIGLLIPVFSSSWQPFCYLLLVVLDIGMALEIPKVIKDGGDIF
jgi:hypothetical protein